MSDFPPRVETLREMIRVALPEADFLIEEFWVSDKLPWDGYVSRRVWRVSIQEGPEKLPTIIDVPDKVVLESTKTATILVTKSAKLVLRPKRRPS